MSTDPPQGAAPSRQSGDSDGYTVDARGAMGVQVGEGGTQIIYSSKSFCGCGNPAEFQCRICRTGICGACDVIEWRKRNGRRRSDSSVWFPSIVVPAPGAGYLKKIEKAVIEGEITGNRIMEVQMATGTTIGPILYADDILPGLTEVFGDLRHVCCTCITAAAVTAAEGIISGKICRMPGCGMRAAVTCTCCGGFFCNGYHGDPFRRATSKEFLIGEGGWLRWFRPVGLCITCASEHAEALEKRIVSRLEGYGFVGTSNRAHLPESPLWKQQKSSRRQSREFERAKEEARQAAKRCYAELQVLIDQSAAVGIECEHPQWFAAPDTLDSVAEFRGDGKLTIYRYIGYVYAIVDERNLDSAATS